MKPKLELYKLFLGVCVLLIFSLSAIGFKPDVKVEAHLTGGTRWIDPEASEAEPVKEGPKPDHPDGALRFRRLQLQDEKGFIPANGLEIARRQVELMKAAQQERNKNRPASDVLAGIKPDSWTWLGPGNIGGRIRSIVIHPTAPNTMWVGSVSGGIWRTDNGGASWFPVNDFLANLAVSTMVMNPTNSTIMYAGTGEGFWGYTPDGISNGDGLQGAGIFESTDTGVTWTQLPSTTDSNFLFVNRLAISPNGNTILAATSASIWQSTNGGSTFRQARNANIPPQLINAAFLDADFHPSDSSRAIAGGLASALFSTDGGGSWAAATFTPPINPGGTGSTNGRVELAYAPSNPSIVYAMVNTNEGDFYRSTDGGQTYSIRNPRTHFLGDQGWYDNILWVNPLDATNVLSGGIGLWNSIDGGASFVLITGDPVAPHADQHIIVAHPGFNNTTNRTVFFGNDGGIFRANDVAHQWTALNNNLGITQFYGAAGNSTTGVIIGGTQDNGTIKYNNDTESWTTMLAGDGGFCAADPTDPNYFYGEYINLQIYRSTDGGATANYIYTGITDANNCPSRVCNANFIAPFVLDPNAPNAMLAGGISLWRSTDVKAATPTWAAIKAPSGANNPISAIVISPGTSSFICVGHNNGDIYKTTSGNLPSPIWTKIDPPALPNRLVTRLVIDNTKSPNWIYATFGGFSTDNVYRSTDLGATWIDITGSGASGLPNVPVRSLVYHPRNPNLLYIGTEIGIFTSDDAGATWELPQGGPANVSVDELFWLKEDLIAVTHGRGLYRASGGIYVDCNYNGTELGTFDQPFKTISAAINSVTTFRIVWIKPCNYNEPIPITKRLELRSLGGTAAIGRP